MKRLAIALVLVLLVGASCRSPGNPPHRPTNDAYQDIIRREIDSAHSALATSNLVLRYAAAGRIPDTYAQVVLRQAANDLRKTAQDIRQIDPPSRAARAQTRLLRICQFEASALANVRRHLHEAGQRARVQVLLARDAKLLDDRLSTQLDPS